MEIYQIISLGLILFTTAMFQSMVGFAFSLLAIPFLLFLGLTLPEAVAVSLLGKEGVRRKYTYNQ